jgi:concanavalin A-like lectin/glucanase superfamily protein
MATSELFTTSFFSDPNLKAYWRFNSGNLTDSIGSVVMSSGTGSTSIAGGKFGFGRDYDGVDFNSNTYIPYSSTFAPNNRKTISFWLMINSLPITTDYIMDDSNTNSGASNFIRMSLNSSGIIGFTIVGSTTAFSPQNTSALSTATWYHLAVTHNGNGSNIIMYLNGIATGAGTAITEAIGTNSKDLYFGRLQPAHGGTGFEPDMTIDDLAIFDRVLTASEVNSLANGFPAGFFFFM